ncbi:SRPBCC domain-containing protein [Actinomycetospora aeridis]|uniref:SRPBCC domain-containing protein n=1 Tax=Actinomycetospora aeridis TaxID=3129231 RepID=A0ABU8NAH2_9PSEU
MTTPPADTRTDPDGTTTAVWRREYPDPVEDVWAAITESERLGRWIGTWTSETEPRVGGTVSFTLTGEVDAGGEVDEPADVRILACEPPRHLRVEFPAPDDQAWLLDLAVEPHGTGAVLVFAQRLVDGMKVEDVDAGWRWYLDRLGASLAGTPMPDWSAYAPA